MIVIEWWVSFETLLKPNSVRKQQHEYTKQCNTVKTKLVAAFATLGLTSLSQAALISVNFDQFTPSGGTPPLESALSGPAGGLASQWNSAAADSIASLI